MTWLDDRQQDTWRRYLLMQRLLAVQLSRHLQRTSALSAADYEVLVQLSEAGGGRMRAFEIGKATQWEKSRLSHHLSRMAQRGLICRETCAKDTRYADIVLTEEGRAAIEQAAAGHVAEVRRLFIDALTPEQMDALDDVCQTVLARLGEEPDDAIEQACDKLCE